MPEPILVSAVEKDDDLTASELIAIKFAGLIRRDGLLKARLKLEDRATLVVSSELAVAQRVVKLDRVIEYVRSGDRWPMTALSPFGVDHPERARDDRSCEGPQHRDRLNRPRGTCR